MIVEYIEWLYPGSFFAESSTEPVPNRERPREIPENANGYRFFSRQEIESQGEVLRGKNTNYSGWTYFGEEYDHDALNELGEDYNILKSNIISNGYRAAVKTINGNWYPLHDNDRVVDVRSFE